MNFQFSEIFFLFISPLIQVSTSLTLKSQKNVLFHLLRPKNRFGCECLFNRKLVSNSQSIDLWKCFKHVVEKLWALWELVLTGDPILVLTHSPTQSSDAGLLFFILYSNIEVLGLVSLISPVSPTIVCCSEVQLVYGGDFRPYFTIYDSDFKIYTSNNHKVLVLFM